MHIIITFLCRKSSDTIEPGRSTRTPSSSKIKHTSSDHSKNDIIVQLVRRVDDLENRVKALETASSSKDHTSRAENNGEDNFDDDLKF